MTATQPSSRSSPAASTTTCSTSSPPSSAARTPWSHRPAYDAARNVADKNEIRDLILANIIALLSGPGQIASVLRTGTLPPPAASIGLPLDVILVCAFHHLIHRWGWTITLNPDGTTTMTSPDRSRVYHSHSPPAAA